MSYFEKVDPKQSFPKLEENIQKFWTENKIFQKSLDKNIFSYEIENISKSVLSGLKQTLYPGMKIEETLLNMKILDSWKND